MTMRFAPALDIVTYIKCYTGGDGRFYKKLDTDERDPLKVPIEDHMIGFQFFNQLEGEQAYPGCRNVKIESEPFNFSPFYYCNVEFLTFAEAKLRIKNDFVWGDDIEEAKVWGLPKDSEIILYMKDLGLYHRLEFKIEDSIILEKLGCTKPTLQLNLPYVGEENGKD